VLSQSSSRVFPSGTAIVIRRSAYRLDLLLEETELKESLTDPLFPSYLERALTSQFIPPNELLSSLIKVLPTLEPRHELSRYPLYGIIMQAIAAWKPSLPATADDVTLLWEVERVLHQSVTDEARGEDSELSIKAFFAWLRLLVAPSTRALLLSEKEKNRGIIHIYIELTENNGNRSNATLRIFAVLQRQECRKKHQR
jgi:hypothetical protein